MEVANLSEFQMPLRCLGHCIDRARPVLADTVEKLCFEKRRDFICDLTSVSYASYEGVAEVA